MKTIFVACEGVSGRNCEVLLRIVPGHPVAHVVGRHPDIPDEAIRQELKKQNLVPSF